MKFEVFVSRTGYFEIEAKDEEEARSLTEGVPFSHVSWSDDWTVDDIQPSEE